MEKIIERVLHPTDLSDGSKVAFYHALRAALHARSRLTMLHVAADGKAAWSDFPGVRQTLERWGLIKSGSPKSAVADLGIDVSKNIASQSDPVKAVLGYLAHHPAELIVLATHERRGAARWLNSSVAEPISRRATEMTLFISGETSGFVSADDGSVKLRNILIPIALTPRAQPALAAAARFVRSFQCTEGTFHLLHVGDSSSAPAVNTPEVPGWDWKFEVRSGDVIQNIIDASEATRSDLIVMATDGPNGFLDGLRGSHSERVVRLASVPLLTVPVGSYVSETISAS